MAAKNMKLPPTALLILYGMIVLMAQTKGSEAKICPLFCLRVAYMTCPSSGNKQLPAGCNCCLTSNSKGCTLHIFDAPPVKCP